MGAEEDLIVAVGFRYKNSVKEKSLSLKIII
jgi:hypothetical protein